MARQHGVVGPWLGSHQRISGRLGELGRRLWKCDRMAWRQRVLGRRIGLVARRRWSLGFVEALSGLSWRGEAHCTRKPGPASGISGSRALRTVVWRAAF